MEGDVIIGIDAGTSVMKSIAFALSGEQLAVASRPNHYHLGEGATATQSPVATWADCAATLQGLAEKVDGLASRVAAIAVTGQGDGTWLIDAEGEPTTDALLWLDGRANPTVQALRRREGDAERYAITGTGLAACQMAPQLIHLRQENPAAVCAATTAFHCKDWLYYKLTGVRATDPTEGASSFGDFRTRTYSDDVFAILGLQDERRLMPQIVDGIRERHTLSAAAASATGLTEGTPVVLAYLDVPCTALGAGIYDPTMRPGCSIVGSTGIHMRLATPGDVVLGKERTGYVMTLPVEGFVAQVQSNLAATLNIDWVLKLASGLLADLDKGDGDHRALLSHMDRWVETAPPAELIYHPYISEAGERGPITDGSARASFIGLTTRHGFADLVRAVVEGLAYAARDCYEAIGGPPDEVRLGGGAARSKTLRRILGAALGTNVRSSLREEAGAAGAAMIAAVNLGAYPSMDECAAEWVAPLLQQPEMPDGDLARRYAAQFPAYRAARQALPPVWSELARVARA